MLGEDVDNPKVTFKAIQNLLEERINLLSKRLYDFIKGYEKEEDGMKDLDKDADQQIDSLESELFYKIKNHIGSLHEGLDELDSNSLMLQKQITTLKKEKVDLMLQIKAMNTKLDDIEKDLGVNIAAKRAKKKI